jgi:peptide/nickel transport system substrate-binding protein
MTQASNGSDVGGQELGRLVEGLTAGQVSRRVFVRRAAAIGVSLPTISAILAACGGEDGNDDAGSAGAPATAGDPSKLTPGKPGGTLREGYDRDFSRMDPINTTWYDPGFFALYEGIITLDTKRKFVPEIAEKWRPSSDGKVWTFKIRKGLKFHSGAPLDAQAIADVFNEIINPKAGSPQLAQWAPVEKTVATDATTLEVHVKHSFANLPNVISTGYSRIVNLKARNDLGDDYGKKLIDGSGPFEFVEWVPGDHVTVKRWEEYPGAIVPFFVNKEKAYLDEIRWTYVAETATRALQLQNRELDSLKGPAPQDIDRLQKDPNLVVTELGEQALWYMGLNFESLGFNDLRVRQAVAQALDRQAIVDKLVFGHGTPAFGPIPPSSPDYNDAVEKHNGFDLDQAKELMRAAGWQRDEEGILAKDGKKFSFQLITSVDSFEKQLASVVQEQLRALGMEVRVRNFDEASKFEQLGNGVDAFLFKYSWPNTYDVFIVVSDSKAAPFPNWQRAKLPDLDKAHRKYQQAATLEELDAASKEGQRVGAEQLPFVPIFGPSTAWVTQKYVRNYLPISWNLYPYYTDVWMDNQQE